MPIHVIGGVSQRPGPPACDPGCMFILYLNHPERCLGSLLGSLYSILYFTYFTQTAARGPTRNTCTFSFTLWTFYCFDRSLGWPHFYHFSPNILNVYTTPTLWFSSQACSLRAAVFTRLFTKFLFTTHQASTFVSIWRTPPHPTVYTVCNMQRVRQ